MKRLSSTNQNSTSLTNVPDPTNPQDAATKAYVDANVGSGDVVGPASSVDNTLAIFNSTTGKLLKSTGGTSSNQPISYGLDTTGILKPYTGASHGQQFGMSGTDAGSTTTNGGNAKLRGGTAGASSGSGGDVSIQGGFSPAGAGGNTYIYGGSTSSGSVGNTILGNPGNVQIQKNGTAFNLTLDVTGLSASRIITFPDYAGTLATLAGTEVLTNKTLSGASNTLSNIGNSSLTNSSVTIGSTSVALGATAATLAGLTLTTPTIASFTNATHNHTNAAGGGQITDAALSSAVTVAKGGTGNTTATTAYGLQAAGTTATGAHQTLPAGATTQILVGGGASALPVWTTASGSGAPVRATSPTIVTPTIASFTNATHDHSNSAGGGTLTHTALPVGAVVQMLQASSGAVATGTTILPTDDTIPQITEGTEFITQAITPKSTTNTLIIEACIYGSYSVNNANLTAALFQDSTANALAAGLTFEAVGTAPDPIMVSHSMTAGTTSSTTFRVRAGAQTAGTFTFNGNSGGRNFGAISKSWLRITEVKA